MSTSKTEQPKPLDEPKSSSPDLVALMTKVVEQNSLLIELLEAKEQTILRLIEQNDEILNELIEQQDGDDEQGSTYLDG